MPAEKQKVYPLGNLEDFHRERHIFDLFFTRGIGRVSVITSNIVRFQYTVEKDWSYKPLLSIEEKEWKSVPIQIKRHTEKLDIMTPKLIISLVFKPFNIRIYDHEGHLLVQDNPKCSATYKGTQIAVHKKCPTNTPIIGMGDQHGNFDRSGRAFRFEMMKSTEKRLKAHSNPQLIFPTFCYKGKDISVGYFLDNPNNSIIDLRNSVRGDFSMITDNGNLDYYTIIGDELKDVTAGISLLIGNSIFPPRWSLEIMKGLETQLDPKKFLKVYKQIREKFLYTSSIIAQQPENDSTGFWDDRPVNLLKSFKRSDQIPHFMMEIDQKIQKDSLQRKTLKALIAKDAFIMADPNASKESDENQNVYLDPFHEPGNDYIESSLKPLFDEQLRGIEVRDDCPYWTRSTIGDQKVHCIQEIIAEDGESVEKLVHEIEAKNLLAYIPNGLVKNIVSAYAKAKPDLRPLVVSSSGYAGVQRYSVVRPIHTKMDWPDISKFLTRILSLNISGAPLICVDINLSMDFEDKFMTRLIQALAFVPIIRLRIAKDFDLEKILGADHFLETLDSIFRLREAWLPYLYQLMWSSHKEGTPILYPIIYFYPEIKDGGGLLDMFMVGEHVLVAPMVKDKKSRDITLPTGDWIDVNTYELVQGGKTISYDVDDKTIPMFLKEGAIVPQFNSETPGLSKSVIVTFFPKNDVISESVLYDDDGDSSRYNKDFHACVNLRLSGTKKGFVLKLSRRQGRINPSWANYLFCFANSRLDISKVVYNRVELDYLTSLDELIAEKTGFFLDDEKELLYVKVPYEREGGVVRF
jgi:alpha-glucosidase